MPYGPWCLEFDWEPAGFVGNTGSLGETLQC